MNLKGVLIGFLILLLCRLAGAQWKVETVETVDKVSRVAYVKSYSGDEVFRIIRKVIPAPSEYELDTDNKPVKVDLYRKLNGQIVLNNELVAWDYVTDIRFRFSDDPIIYIHQPLAFPAKWDANIKSTVIEIKFNYKWKRIDLNENEISKNPINTTLEPLSSKDFIELLKLHKKLFCQINLIDTNTKTKSIINLEFTLQNSTNALIFLFQ